MILLTGASGFIGKHLLAALTKEYGQDNVLGLTSTSELHGVGEKIKIIIHAGAFTPKNGKSANDADKCNTNITYTTKLLEVEFPVLEKIIYLSTLDVYGPANLISENSPVEPASLYGESKLQCEKMIVDWASEHKVIAQILRLGHVYGPGEEAYEKIIPVTFRRILNNEPIKIWGSGKELRSFIFIDDVVKAIMTSIKLKDNNELINIAGGHPICMIELVNKMTSISGKKTNIEFESSATPGKDLVFDISKLRSLLLKNETELEEGLTTEWAYLKNQAL
jgi:nucleoside-diphosphate-sugar epimerase